MILVTVGTNEAAFDRLIAAIDRFPADEEVVAQCGSSSLRPVRASCFDFVPFDELAALAHRARVVVSHAGAGSALLALTNGKRPIVVPRLRRFGEAVDDHQLPFARRLAEQGLVTLIEDLNELPRALVGPRDASYSGAIIADERLVEELRTLITATVEGLDEPSTLPPR